MPSSVPGAIVRLARAASVQFAASPILFRVIRIRDDWDPYYDGWSWLDGYQLDAKFNAVKRRNVYVRIAGVTFVLAAAT